MGSADEQTLAKFNRLNFEELITGMVNNTLHYGSYFKPIETLQFFISNFCGRTINSMM